MKNITTLACLFVLCTAAMSAQGDRISYDVHGRVVSIRYANGQEIRYSYDNYNNLTATRNVVSSVDESGKPPTISVKPNPASDQAIVEVAAPEGTAVTFRVITSDGRQVLRKQVLADERGMARTTLTRDQDGLATGQYQVTVATTEGRSAASVAFSD